MMLRQCVLERVYPHFGLFKTHCHSHTLNLYYTLQRSVLCTRCEVLIFSLQKNSDNVSWNVGLVLFQYHLIFRHLVILRHCVAESRRLEVYSICHIIY